MMFRADSMPQSVPRRTTGQPSCSISFVTARALRRTAHRPRRRSLHSRCRCRKALRQLGARSRACVAASSAAGIAGMGLASTGPVVDMVGMVSDRASTGAGSGWAEPSAGTRAAVSARTHTAMIALTIIVLCMFPFLPRNVCCIVAHVPMFQCSNVSHVDTPHPHLQLISFIFFFYFFQNASVIGGDDHHQQAQHCHITTFATNDTP